MSAWLILNNLATLKKIVIFSLKYCDFSQKHQETVFCIIVSAGSAIYLKEPTLNDYQENNQTSFETSAHQKGQKWEIEDFELNAYS